jgi:antitoxin component of MazEF toxin-antitoxin module
MEVFRSKLRRVGTSLGVLIPKGVLDAAGVHEGDEVELSFARTEDEREKILREMAGVSKGLPPFRRDERDRY